MKEKKSLFDFTKDDIIKSKSIRAASRRRTLTTAIIVFIVFALVVTGTTWGVITLVDNSSMRVIVDQSNVGNIALSPTQDFVTSSAVLRMQGPEEMTNITYDWIDKDNILGQEGNHHGEHYVAYSFFLKNVGMSDIIFASDFMLTYTSRDIERALRILVIEDETKAVCYALSRPSGAQEYIAYDTDDEATQQPLPLGDTPLDNLLKTNVTTGFGGEDEDGNTVVFKGADTFLKVDEVKKYTVLIWLEGSDSDCLDSIIGAKVSFEYNFFVTETNAIQP